MITYVHFVKHFFRKYQNLLKIQLKKSRSFEFRNEKYITLLCMRKVYLNIKLFAYFEDECILVLPLY